MATALSRPADGPRASPLRPWLIASFPPLADRQSWFGASSRWPNGKRSLAGYQTREVASEGLARGDLTACSLLPLGPGRGEGGPDARPTEDELRAPLRWVSRQEL